MKRNRRGFSLIEVFISVTVLAAFFGVVYETVIVGLREVETHDEREDARRQVTQALDRLVREASVATEMDAAETDRIQFDAASLSNVEYDYDSAADTLTRDDGSSSAVIIARGLTAFDFDYLDCLGVAYTGTVSTEDRVRVAQIVATLTDGSETVSLTNAVFLRGTIGDDSSYCGGL
jgi:prepilin-type N-terminal cleavage/methylation domain-containing protein